MTGNEKVRHLRTVKKASAAGFVCAVVVRLAWRDRLRALLGRPIRVKVLSRTWPTKTSELLGVMRLLEGCESYSTVDPLFKRITVASKTGSDAPPPPPIAA